MKIRRTLCAIATTVLATAMWLTPVSVHAATLTASSCSRTDVGNAVTAAVAGDTVLIPAGTCSWTTQLDVTKGITLLGNGIDRTILQDNVPKDGSPSSRLMVIRVTQPQNFRFGNLTIQGVATDPSVYNKGHILLDGTSKAFRLDHVKFVNQTTSAIFVDGYLWGVIDHCEFNADFKQAIVVLHTNWGGQSYGDGSWAEQLYLGTERAVYVEDNVFNELSQSSSAGAMDSYNGGRYVFRHNILNNQVIVSHGADTSGRDRSQRSFEYYDNQFNRTGTPASYARAIFVRGGTGVIFNNSFSNVYNNIADYMNYRDTAAYAPWGQCNGSSAYDQNAASGYRCVDQPGAGTSNLLTGSTPPAQWVGNALDPIYQWNNTYGGASNPTNVVSTTNVKVNRDFYNNTPRPGYTPYTYPHPLTLGATPKPPTAPNNVRIIR